MSRNIPVTALQNLSEDTVRPFFAVELLFDGSETVRMWSGYGTLIDNNSVEWTGTGDLLEISSIEETSSISVLGATLTMSGVASELVSLSLSSPYQGRVCNIHFGTLPATGTIKDAEGRITVGDAMFEAFSGYMDEMNIDDGPSGSTIELKVENKLIDLERVRVSRFTSEYQKSVYPSDKGLDFVDSLQDQEVFWGRSG